jgi:hypothetical protein
MVYALDALDALDAQGRVICLATAARPDCMRSMVLYRGTYTARLNAFMQAALTASG